MKHLLRLLMQRPNPYVLFGRLHTNPAQQIPDPLPHLLLNRLHAYDVSKCK